MCRTDGSGFDDFDCDARLGMGCDLDTGLCDGPCAPNRLGSNYIGCEYYPTAVANEVDSNFEYAIAVSNTWSETAEIHIEGGALPTPLTFAVAPDTVEVRRLPWVPALKACNRPGGQLECGAPENSSALVRGGAYHLRATRPVTVYQFNPLDYQLPNNQASYSNDASLLLPANTLAGEYVVASYPMFNFQDMFVLPGLIAVTATRDGTEVTVRPRAAVAPGSGVPAIPRDQAQAFTLNAGDVVQLFTVVGDLTGSEVTATAPVQVIGGHYCTYIPQTVAACDHLEESMFPVQALDRRYVVAAPATPGLENGKVRVVRVIATQANTALRFDPPQPGAATSLARVGDFVELVDNDADFVIEADAKIVVAEYMEGQGRSTGFPPSLTGDPAMALAVPVGQYRADYQFHAPQNYESNYVTVVAPAGARVWLDDQLLGQSLGHFTPVGASDFQVARVPLPAKPSGNYTAHGDEPFGITVYGYGAWTSYWYPGGLDLAPLIVEGPARVSSDE